MIALIFGAGGQDGYYLSKLLAGRGHTVVTVFRARWGAPHFSWAPSRRFADVEDRAAVTNLIKNIQPDQIYHLAAKSTTSPEAAYDNHAAISTGAVNILEAVRNFAPGCRVFLCGSAMQFLNWGQPIGELTPFEAKSPYAAARIGATYTARYYRDVHGVLVRIGYLFNHDSPRRGERHVSMKVAAAARRIAAGSKELVELGDISVRKEHNFAGDIARAMVLLTEQDLVHEAVIGGGVASSIAEWAESCFVSVGLDWRDHVRVVDKNFKPEYHVLVSNPTVICGLGWRPQILFHELADMMVKGDAE